MSATTPAVSWLKSREPKTVAQSIVGIVASATAGVMLLPTFHIIYIERSHMEKNPPTNLLMPHMTIRKNIPAVHKKMPSVFC